MTYLLMTAAKLKPRFEVDYEAYLDRLWQANDEIFRILKESHDLDTARDALFSYLERAERDNFQLENDLHILEKATVRECIRAFKSIIGPVNEYRTGVSALEHLWKTRPGQTERTTDRGFRSLHHGVHQSVPGSGGAIIYLPGIIRNQKRHP